MKIIEFLKKEASDWKIYETLGLLFIFLLIFYNFLFLHDSAVAVLSSFCGILYTILAGKGKIYCYLFGLIGSGCYVTLSFLHGLWGNGLLYLLYYIPMQILGIFKWKKYLKTNSAEIIKSKLSLNECYKFIIIAILGSIITILILSIFNDKSPIIDGITTFLSIIGMYFTVRRLTEQWVIWMIVNGLSFVMWLLLIISGVQAYSTLVMWCAYFVMAIYFYNVWTKESN